VRRRERPTVIYAWEFGEDKSIDDLIRRGSSLDEKSWAAVRTAVSAGPVDTEFGDELILDARAFYHSNDFRMVVLVAAIAAEFSLTALVQSCLSRDGRVSRNQAGKYSELESNRRLPILLQAFGLLENAEAEAVSQLFDRRNGIVHAKNKRAVSRKTANQAIELAQLLRRRAREATQ